MNGHIIIPSKYIKYLGVYLDQTLNGSFHCKNLVKNLKRANGMLCKARHYINNDDLKTLYYAIFSSHLIYGSQIWGQHINTFNNKIFKLQNRALRIIYFDNFRADSNPLYINLKIVRLACVRNVLRLCWQNSLRSLCQPGRFAAGRLRKNFSLFHGVHITSSTSH